MQPPRGSQRWAFPAFPSLCSSFSRGSCSFLRVQESAEPGGLWWGRRWPHQLRRTSRFPCVCRGRSSLQLGRTRICCRRDQKLSAALVTAQAHTRLLPVVGHKRLNSAMGNQPTVPTVLPRLWNRERNVFPASYEVKRMTPSQRVPKHKERGHLSHGKTKRSCCHLGQNTSHVPHRGEVRHGW